jgi:hypothetical protein
MFHKSLLSARWIASGSLMICIAASSFAATSVTVIGPDGAVKTVTAEEPQSAAQSESDASRARSDIQRSLEDARRAAQDAVRAAGDAAQAAAQAAIASVDVNEIRETVRRAMDEAGRGGVSMVSSSDTPQRGNPYSAKETRQFKQTLGDGTQITRQSVRILARDGEGRTRQELQQPDGSSRVFINDPVAKQAIILDPQKKTACKSGFDSDAIHDCFKQMRGDWKPLGFSFNASSKSGIAMMTATDDVRVNVSPNARVIDLTQSGRSGEGQNKTWSKWWSCSGAQCDSGTMPAPPPAPVAPAPPVPPIAPLSPLSNAKDGSVKRERITQTYEGLRVDVDRSVETIAAGSIGNSRAIESVYERFYSPELKMTVFRRSADPRNGESIYRMENIKRSEPDVGAFRIPAGFTETSGKSK